MIDMVRLCSSVDFRAILASETRHSQSGLPMAAHFNASQILVRLVAAVTGPTMAALIVAVLTGTKATTNPKTATTG
ncbi:hypothetical protein LB518_13415 [Mesorhizobium sp. BR1-1-16]|uniref:hypothetical protein n=1 Tax=Mesorhizobium sp. BR1-1-16 TaxID=2876653 RepID=UPI001CCFB0E5|nr:hypothetical protein [Mesorhizobium sp. BR1-1-16]MBZ9937297.1 hypothetical protein [Mesorhizobium sp. BR1-1-16]